MAVSDFPSPRGTGVAFVTGAGGFIGSAAAAAFGRAGWRVAALGHARRWADVGPHPVPPAPWFERDIGAPGLAAARRAVGRPEVIFHAAGGGSVGASLADPVADHRRTVGSLAETLAFMAAEAPDARLIYPSSAAVYGEAAAGPIPESLPAAPVSPYGRHKAEAERLILEATGAGLDATVLRFFSVYGPGLRKQLLWELGNRLLAAPAQVELAGHGDEARDFLFIDDAVGLIGLAAGLERQAAPLIVNGGAGRPASVRQIAEALVAALGVRSRVVFNGEVREGDPRSLVADVARAEALGFRPATPLADGMARLARWLLALKAGAAA
jgi:UDP-glucose 4-epimerase